MIVPDHGFFVDIVTTGTDIKLDDLETVMPDAKSNRPIHEANAALILAMLKHLFVEAV